MVSKRRIGVRKRGGKEEREEQNANHTKLITKRIPEDTMWLGPPFPQQILSSYTNLSICGPLSQKP
jgi:hypothetical protein